MGDIPNLALLTNCDSGHWSVNFEFYSGLGIWSFKSGFSANKSSKNWWCCAKMRGLLKNSFAKGYVFETGRNVVRKRKVYKIRVVLQSSAAMNQLLCCYQEKMLKMQGHIKMLTLEMLTLTTPILLLTRVILQWSYVRLKVHYWKYYMCIKSLYQIMHIWNYLNTKDYLLRVMFVWVVTSRHEPNLCQLCCPY